MKLIIGAARGGKTTQLIRMSAKTGDCMVVYNREAAMSAVQMAQRMGVTIPHPLTYAEFITRQYEGKIISGFLIDNVDELLQYMTVIPIRAMSVTPG